MIDLDFLVCNRKPRLSVVPLLDCGRERRRRPLRCALEGIDLHLRANRPSREPSGKEKRFPTWGQSRCKVALRGRKESAHLSLLGHSQGALMIRYRLGALASRGRSQDPAVGKVCCRGGQPVFQLARISAVEEKVELVYFRIIINQI